MVQHALFAQQRGTHGLSLAVSSMIQGLAGNRTVAVNSATTIATETVILRIINELIAQLSPQIEILIERWKTFALVIARLRSELHTREKMTTSTQPMND